MRTKAEADEGGQRRRWADRGDAGARAGAGAGASVRASPVQLVPACHGRPDKRARVCGCVGVAGSGARTRSRARMRLRARIRARAHARPAHGQAGSSQAGEAHGRAVGTGLTLLLEVPPPSFAAGGGSGSSALRRPPPHSSAASTCDTDRCACVTLLSCIVPVQVRISMSRPTYFCSYRSVYQSMPRAYRFLALPIHVESMHHRCSINSACARARRPGDVPLMYQQCAADAPAMLHRRAISASPLHHRLAINSLLAQSRFWETTLFESSNDKGRTIDVRHMCHRCTTDVLPMHRRCTTDVQPMRHGWTINAPSVPHQCTMKAPSAQSRVVRCVVLWGRRAQELEHHAPYSQ